MLASFIEMYFSKYWKACLKTANNSNKFFVCVCLQMNRTMRHIQEKFVSSSLQPTPLNGLLKVITKKNYTVILYTVHAGTEGTPVSPFDLKGVLYHQRTWLVVWLDWCLTVSVSHQPGSKEDQIITSGSPPGIYLDIKNTPNMKPWLLTFTKLLVSYLN